MTKTIQSNGSKDTRSPPKGKRISKGGKPSGFSKPKGSSDRSDNPQVAKMQNRDQQRDSLRKLYAKILNDIKNKDKSSHKGITEFLAYLKKNSQEATRKLVGIKCLILILKYGKKDQKETALLTLMASDPSLLIPLKSGAFLFAQIYKYCANLTSIRLLNEFFASQFSKCAKKVSCFQSLSAYIGSLSLRAQGDILTANRSNFELDSHSIKDLMESYQKSRRQFSATVHQYAILVNFEFPNQQDLFRRPSQRS